ncbi:hypothetical protein [Streptomyces sp. NPDC101776]|uniref:hypothetical protein n=1 Tax=Streptomyces sp. NPDC101776 TaxID=3366146 RepID=UPI00381E2AF5
MRLAVAFGARGEFGPGLLAVMRRICRSRSSSTRALPAFEPVTGSVESCPVEDISIAETDGGGRVFPPSAAPLPRSID